jgi:hypothetical protein
MDWSAGAVVALLGGAGAALLMWRAGFFVDEEGRFAPNRFHAAILAIATLAGFVSGSAGGVLDGLACVVAGLNVAFATVLAWGLSGGDGEAPNTVVGLLGVAIFAAAVAAFVAALPLDEPGPGTLALLVLPAILALAAFPLTDMPDRLRGALYSLALFATPPALVAPSLI